jgi:hypothetical protein
MGMAIGAGAGDGAFAARGGFGLGFQEKPGDAPPESVAAKLALDSSSPAPSAMPTVRFRKFGVIPKPIRLDVVNAACTFSPSPP